MLRKKFHLNFLQKNYWVEFSTRVILCWKNFPGKREGIFAKRTFHDGIFHGTFGGGVLIVIKNDQKLNYRKVSSTGSKENHQNLSSNIT